VDGHIYPFKDYQGEAVVKGDSIHQEIMAASIMAKVSRDRYMMEQADLYPEYRFDLHKGYPTRLHFELLQKYGPCPIHRKSFYPVSLFT
jgi:ribonuclease HII